MKNKLIYLLLTVVICMVVVFIIDYKHREIKQELQNREKIISSVKTSERKGEQNEYIETELEEDNENIISEEVILKKQEEVQTILEEEEERKNNLGQFMLTAYCACSECCGKWTGSPTASGVMPADNRTIAVDTSVIPFGTKVMINGRVYIAEDTGSAIIGNRIDIYMSDHQEALNFGIQYAEVRIVE